jgi:excisionase family DNA binding protein
MSAVLEKKSVSLQEAAYLRNCNLDEINKSVRNGEIQLLPSGQIERSKFEDYQKRIASGNGIPLVFKNEDGFFSVKQAAELSKLKASVIYNATTKGNLKFRKNGSRVVLHIDDIKAWMKAENCLKTALLKEIIRKQENGIPLLPVMNGA